MTTLLQRAHRLLRGLGSVLPFLAPAAHAAELIEDPATQAAAIDVNALRIALNPTWAADLDDADLEFVLAHELMHVFLATGRRGRGAEGFRWNFAHDLVINEQLAALLGRAPPRGGVILEARSGIDAETAYLRTQLDRLRGPLRAWVKGRWEIDIHASASPALVNARGGHAANSLAVNGGNAPYVLVSFDAADADEIRGAVVRVTPRRPWPAAWEDLARAAGTIRSRSWRRPTRRADAGVLLPGRSREGGDQLVAILDATPAMLPHAGLQLGMLRAFADDIGIGSLRVIAVDEHGMIADELVEVGRWREACLPSTLVILRATDGERRDGIWICTSCQCAHAAPRPDGGRPAVEAISPQLRAGAIHLMAPL